MNWRIPLADVDFDQEEIQAVEAVLKSKWLTMGAITQQFETNFSDFTGITHSIAVTNCTAGLHLAMAALGIGRGDEVIVPSLSFVATANAVLYSGGTPVFADVVGLDNLTVAPGSIESKISPKTKAIVVMHYAGYACDMENILDIARSHGLYIVEDAAHAIGSSINGKSLGGIGDIGCFSFFPNKNMTTAEGGMVSTKNDDLAKKIRLLRSHGMTSLTWDRHEGHAWSYDVTELGYNYRIDEIRSAIGKAQLKKVENNNRRRGVLTRQYWKLIGEQLPEIHLPFSKHHGEASYHIMPIILPDGVNRTRVMERMKESGIQTSIHYPPIHLFAYYQQLYPNHHLERTEEAAKRELTIPLYPAMNEEDIFLVVKSLKESLI